MHFVKSCLLFAFLLNFEPIWSELFFVGGNGCGTQKPITHVSKLPANLADLKCVILSERQHYDQYLKYFHSSDAQKLAFTPGTTRHSGLSTLQNGSVVFENFNFGWITPSVWNEWQEWTDCSVTCIRNRYRFCKIPFDGTRVIPSECLKGTNNEGSSETKLCFKNKCNIIKEFEKEPGNIEWVEAKLQGILGCRVKE